MDCNPSGSSIHGFFQARILERVAISSSRGSSVPRDRTHISPVSCLAGGFFTTDPLEYGNAFGLSEQKGDLMFKFRPSW